MPAVSTASTITKASKKKSFPKKSSTDRGSLKESDAHIREKKLKDKKRKRSQRKRSTKENPKGDEVVKEKSSNEGASLKPTNSTPAQQVSKPFEPTKEKKKSKRKFLSNEGDSYYPSHFFTFQLILEDFVPLNPGQTSYLELYLAQKNEPCPEVKETPEPEVIPVQVEEPNLPEPVNPIQETPEAEVTNPVEVTLPEAEVPTDSVQVATLLPLDFPVFKTWSSLSQTQKTYFPGDFLHFRKSLKEEESTFFPKDFYFWQDAWTEKSDESFTIEDFFEFRLILDELVPLNAMKKRHTPKTKRVFLVDDGHLFVTDFFSFQHIVDGLESLEGQLSDYDFCLREEHFELYSRAEPEPEPVKTQPVKTQPVKTQEVYFPEDFSNFFQLWTSTPKYNKVFLPNDFYFWKDATNDEDTPSFLPREFFHWQSIFNEKCSKSFLPSDFCSFQDIIKSVEPVPEVHPTAPDNNVKRKEVNSKLPSESNSSSKPCFVQPSKQSKKKARSSKGKNRSKKTSVPFELVFDEPESPVPAAFEPMHESDSSARSSLLDLFEYEDEFYEPDFSVSKGAKWKY
ncbi:uncharacterized protein CXQ87_001249 [Candidozyma duobushaemuli]|uniref:Uncharacterized protein n=2 Tax=Candidozyma TaxID=3303203 RepID=A0ABX8I360_9ASCO|nr:uncharacterized protein CXQ87_001249 [[Candida] duobushaemulonis]PVH18326.1 hypothetical protein CXQ87_001249 [[Candida] duobushaemulonis]QWU86874.1 hypothetical protein CA3LBN_001092 [[Candida] haemuloni]